MNAQRRFRFALLLSLMLVIPLGYGVRFLLSPNLEWLRNWLGNLAYESFWILLIMFLVPRVSFTKVAIGVCLSSFAIEWLQLWHPVWLQAIRATLPGRLVLGNSFFWADFPQYVIGSLVGWLWVRTLLRITQHKQS